MNAQPYWGRSNRLYPIVAWLAESDFVPFGDAETVIELYGGEEIIHGLLIRDPFGRDTSLILQVHSTRGNGNDGGEITLAVRDSYEPPLEQPVQKPHPFRFDADYWREEGA